MARSKQSERRQIAQVRTALHNGKPLAIDARALSSIEQALESGDRDSLQSALTFGVREADTSMQLVDGIAVLPVTGVLRDEVDVFVRHFGATSYQLLERDFKQAIASDSVRGVLLYCDSPGGAAIGVKRVANLIFEARGEKPIRCYVQGVCGSAAYYLAAACDRIEATADSLVGSIGTIFPHVEGSKMFRDFGVTYTVFTNADSPKKGHGNIYEPLTDEARATLQQFTDSYGRPFVEDVARYRGRDVSEVVETFGQGDAFRADQAITRGMVDAVVASFEDALASMGSSGSPAPVDDTDEDETPVVTGTSQTGGSDMDERIKAQLYALGLIDSLEASDKECQAALKAWYRSVGADVPSDSAAVLAGLQERRPRAQNGDDDDDDDDDMHDGDDDAHDGDGDDAENRVRRSAASNVQTAHEQEMSEARLADLRAAAQLVNEGAGCEAVSSDMVLEAFTGKLGVREAMGKWSETLAAREPDVAVNRIRGGREGADRYAEDIVHALVYRTNAVPGMEVSGGAAPLVNRPLWAVAAECLQLAGQTVDMYGDRGLIAEQPMTMGNATQRHTFFSAREGRQYIQAAGVPSSRPGDFPNILSNLANKFLDTVQLDDDYSYPKVSAVLPGGMSDFKPAIMANKGIVEELDELTDAEQFKELGLSEEVLSYLFLRRFGNKWGWTPLMIANDDLGAFVEGMLGLEEAWQVTQNRLVVDQFTANANLLDSTALFANRADVEGAANNNDRTSGGAPSDSEWEAMEDLYSDIGGIGTGRRVRGALNVCFGPTGNVRHEAIRTFAPLNVGGIEPKQAATTANVSIFRGQVELVFESDLRDSSTTIWYGLRNPTRLNTATVVRGYFNGFGTAGRRERWFDPETKVTYVSIEGRVAVAVKNWRYAIRNNGS